MYLFVIDTYLCPRIKRSTPLYGYKCVQPQRVWFFEDIWVRNRVLVILLLHFSLEFGMFSVFKRSYAFIIIDIRPAIMQAIVDKTGDQVSSNIMIDIGN